MRLLPRLRPPLASTAALWLAACALVTTSPPPPTAGQLKPTCPDVELDACIAESVTVTARDLGLDASDYALIDRRPLPVRCILRETGLIEACHVLDPRGSPLDDSVQELLARRRYQPPTFRRKPVLVPYTFLVSFAPPPAEAARTTAVRLEVFKGLLARLWRSTPDAGTEARPLICVGVGDDVADPPRADLEALAHAGARVEPASSCWGLIQVVGNAAPFGSIVVREVRFDRPDVAEVRAELGVSGQSPDYLTLRASRLGGRWLIEELAPPDAGVR